MPLRREAILQAHLLGIHTLFADHSLIGFEDVASILTIKLLVETLAHVFAASCIAYWVCQFHYALSYSKR